MILLDGHLQEGSMEELEIRSPGVFEDSQSRRNNRVRWARYYRYAVLSFATVSTAYIGSRILGLGEVAVAYCLFGLAAFWIVWGASIALWDQGFPRAGALARLIARHELSPHALPYDLWLFGLVFAGLGLWTLFPNAPPDPGHEVAVFCFGWAIVFGAIGALAYRYFVPWANAERSRLDRK
jgi:hypothetical protein